MNTSQRQQDYFMAGINRALPVSSLPDESTLRAALGGPDATAPWTVANWAVAGMSNPAVAADAACRRQPYPNPGLRPADARTGCGWWFVPDPAQPSTAAYGTRRAPMSPLLDQQAGTGRWIWDLEEAQVAESLKRAAAVKSCADLAYATMPGIGWCTSTGRAIPVDAQGNPRYPKSTGGDCPGGTVVTTAAGCPTGSTGFGPRPADLTSQCTDGALTPACLQQLSSQVCGANGTLTQAYASGWPATNAPVAAVNAIAARGFELNAAVLSGGQTTTKAALQNFQGLRTLAYSNTDPSLARAAAAAANLCGGQAFDPCAASPADRGPFDADCIARYLLSIGYKSAGSLVPTGGGGGGGSTVLAYWNGLGTWGAIQAAAAAHKAAADAPGPSQVDEIANVYGARVRIPKTSSCHTQGLTALRWAATMDASLFPAVPGAQTHFLGRSLVSGGVPTTSPSKGPENMRVVTVFTPTVGGEYQFMLSSVAGARLSIDGQVYMAVAGSGGAGKTGPLIPLVADVPVLVVIDLLGSDTWGLTVQYAVNGGSWTALPAAQLAQPQDRRLPLLDLSFNTWTPTSSQTTAYPTARPTVVLPNLYTTANIGTIAGQNCLLIDGPGRGIVNYTGINQGLRLLAFKAFTMRLLISGASAPIGVTPSVVSFYNLPQSTVAPGTYPRSGWSPLLEQPYQNRTSDFMITTNGAQIYPYGAGPLYGSNVTAGSAFLATLGKTAPVTANQWFHFVFQWDDDYSGYSTYINGVLVTHARLPSSYSPALVLEQIRIGCDVHPEGQAWTGGIAWFRAFDYRLTDELIAVDMNDGWSTLH